MSIKGSKQCGRARHRRFILPRQSIGATREDVEGCTCAAACEILVGDEDFAELVRARERAPRNSALSARQLRYRWTWSATELVVYAEQSSGREACALSESTRALMVRSSISTERCRLRNDAASRAAPRWQHARATSGYTTAHPQIKALSLLALA